MIVWFSFAALTVAAVVLLLWPLMSKASAGLPRAEYDLKVFRDQLSEVERDVEAGLLSDELAEAARLEIKRRMLAAGAAAAEAEGQDGGRARLILAGVVGVAVPLAAFGIYAKLGSPRIPDMPAAQMQASRLGVSPEQARDVAAMVESLAKKLETNPRDQNGWFMLGRSYKALGRYEESVAAFESAARLGPPNAEILSAMAEVMVAANQGQVVPQARQIFLQALAASPRDPRSRLYLGLARAQIGDFAGAIAVWRHLEMDSPPDAPWIKVVRDEIKKVAAASGLDPAVIEPKSELALAGTALPGAARGGVDVSNLAAAMSAPISSAPPPATGAPGMNAPGGSPESSPEVIAKRVADLAARLEKNPNDPDGWAMLGRSYQVLRDAAKAKAAYGRAASQRPEDVALKMAYAQAIIDASPDMGESLPADFVAVMRDVLALQPDQADALYYVGLAEMQAGRKPQAVQLWGKLLSSLDPKSSEYAELKKEIDGLGGSR